MRQLKVVNEDEVNEAGEARRLTRVSRELESDEQKLEKEIAGIASRLEQTRALLAQGRASAKDIAKLEVAAEAAQRESRALQEARARVAQELVPVEARIAEVAAERERRQQERLAAPLRQEADRLVGEFLTRLLQVTEPLVRRAEIADRIAVEFPRAGGINPMTVEQVAMELRRELGGDHRAEDPLAFMGFVRRVLYGATPRLGVPYAAAPLPADLQRQFGLKD